VTLHWHRRDLRVRDNPGLASATAAPEDGVVPVFVLDDAVLETAAPPRLAFMLEALDALRGAYRSRGSDLLVRSGDPAEVLPAVAAEVGATRVTWGEDYSGLARERDRRVREGLAARGIAAQTVHDAVCQPPGSITTADGDPYQVFTYYGRKWHDRPVEAPVDAPASDALAAVDGGAIPTLSDLGFPAPEASIPAGSGAAARDRLAAFCDGPIYRYAEDRDYPGREGTSRLSPHLKFGTVGVRRVHEATETALAAAPDEAARDGVRAFQDQLAWRDFYAQVLWDRPDTVRANYREFERPVAWRSDPEGLRAWKDGETGFPFVDAGMRQLRAEAWMHNRVRMVVASFLTKDLLVDWREGYQWFRERLVDHDTANDVGGWQWAASTGTDAQPYFRVFNPMTQGERFDPEAAYIREYVPELRDVPAAVVHAWDDLEAGERETHAPGYPAPILDHGKRREQAIAMFERARGD